MNLHNVAFLANLGSSTLTSGLIAYYNTTGGTGASEPDLVGGVGTLVEIDNGSTLVQSGSGPGTHKARTFASGTGETLTVHTANGGTFPITLNVWVKIIANGAGGAIPISYGQASTWGPPVNFYSYSGTVYLSFRDTNAVTITGTLPSDYADSAWHMWSFVVDGTKIPKVYINGVLQSISWSGGPFTGTGFYHDCISFGHSLYFDSFNTGDDFQGGIALIGIWNRALTGTEITSLYNGGSGKAYNEL